VPDLLAAGSDTDGSWLVERGLTHVRLPVGQVGRVGDVARRGSRAMSTWPVTVLTSVPDMVSPLLVGVAGAAPHIDASIILSNVGKHKTSTALRQQVAT
jgi:hypothetical protein